MTVCHSSLFNANRQSLRHKSGLDESKTGSKTALPSSTALDKIRQKSRCSGSTPLQSHLRTGRKQHLVRFKSSHHSMTLDFRNADNNQRTATNNGPCIPFRQHSNPVQQQVQHPEQINANKGQPPPTKERQFEREGDDKGRPQTSGFASVPWHFLFLTYCLKPDRKRTEAVLFYAKEQKCSNECSNRKL